MCSLKSFNSNYIIFYCLNTYSNLDSIKSDWFLIYYAILTSYIVFSFNRIVISFICYRIFFVLYLSFYIPNIKSTFCYSFSCSNIFGFINCIFSLSYFIVSLSLSFTILLSCWISKSCFFKFMLGFIASKHETLLVLDCNSPPV